MKVSSSIVISFVGIIVTSSCCLAFVVRPSITSSTQRQLSCRLPSVALIAAATSQRGRPFRSSTTMAKSSLGGINGLQQTTTASSASKSSSSSSSSASALEFVKDLLEGLASENGGKKLLENSAFGWRTAIYEAVGAPTTADEKVVAKALQDAMVRPENQFAILMGVTDDDFEYEYPSDPVDYDDGYCFVEVRLRNNADNELLVTMGLQLQKREEDGHWLVAKLDWQDFRDDFYPGLSGRGKYILPTNRHKQE